MSESKERDEDAYLNGLPQVEVKTIEISPNPAALTDELHLEIDFTVDQAIPDAFWEIKYLVDTVRTRHFIHLGSTSMCHYTAGNNHFQFSTPHIDVSHVKASALTNCGLLIATLKQDEEDIMQIKMVIQVTKQGETLQRHIFNPLE